MSNDALVKTIVIAAPKETVWAYLTDKDKLGTWFHPARENLNVGAGYELLVGGKEDGAKCHGKVLEMDAPNTLKMSFSISPMTEAETMLTWTLDDIEGGTKLTLVHDGMSQAGFGMFSGIDAGWDKHFISLREKAAG